MRPVITVMIVIAAAFAISAVRWIGYGPSRVPVPASYVDSRRGTGALDARLNCLLAHVRRRPVPSRWPVALRLMAREIRSGAALDRAMEVASGAEPTLIALTQVVDRRRIGWRTEGSLNEQIDLASGADDRLAFATIAHLTEHGGQMAASLDRAAATIHEREVMRSERDVQAAQARISAQLLSVIAPLFAGWSVVSDARVRHFLVGTIPGLVCLIIGVALNLAGYAWMHQVVRRP